MPRKLLASLRLTALVLIMGWTGWSAAQADDARPRVPMVDPAIDAEGPWCYLAWPSGQLAVPGAQRGAQVTFDGAINTPGIELVFLTGKPLRPIMVRQKTLKEGYLPIINYHWRESDIIYAIQCFAESLGEHDPSQSAVFVMMQISNDSNSNRKIDMGIATRYSGIDHRFEGLKSEPFSPDWKYELTNRALFRNGALMLVYPEGGTLEAVSGVPYTGPFSGRDFQITERSEVALVKYQLDMAPGEKRHLSFLVPIEPIAASDQLKNEKLMQIGSNISDLHLSGNAISWLGRLHKYSYEEIFPYYDFVLYEFVLAEDKLRNSYRASLMYAMQAIYDYEKGSHQGVNKFQYNWFWLRDGAYIIRMYDLFGEHGTARRVLVPFPKYQKPDGHFESQEGQFDGFGQALFAMGQHAIITGNKEYAELIWKHFPPAVEWLKRARAADPMGLMPRTEARDNELIVGHYTGHNFWALLGLRTAIRIARMTDHQEEAADWLKVYDEYEAHFLKELEKVTGPDGYIPPGLDAEGGQDWGNLIGVYPTEVLAPDDPRVGATLARMHAEKIEEGLMTYMGRLHHYLTVKEAQNHIARGEQEEALRHLYAILLHMDSSHAMFEWQAEPWGSRDVGGNFPPHGWGAAMYNLLLRNMLVREAGGRGGLEPRDLHLFSVVSPEWVKLDESLEIVNMPTEAGPITAAMTFKDDGASVDVDYPSTLSYRLDLGIMTNDDMTLKYKPDWTPAHTIVLHIPYFVTLDSFTSDVSPIERRADALVFPPNVKKVKLKWTRRNVEPLSFEKAVADYKAEYARRFDEYVKAGGVPLKVEAPSLLTAEERRTLFNDTYGTPTVGLAVGKPVTTSGPYEMDHGPERAVDGNARDRHVSSWWAAPPAPHWLQIDLERPTEIAAIHVYPYWDGSRFYQYVVDVSLDGAEWERVADRSQAVEPESAMGHRHNFPPRRARYVRVTMLYNSANTSLHLVEVRVLPPNE